MARTPHPPFGHLLPQGEKGKGQDLAESLLPLREKVDRPEAETDEGLLASLAERDQARGKLARQDWRSSGTPRLRGFARTMRRKPTEVEQRLWSLLRDRRLVGFKFRRQVPVGQYIVDFYCASANLIVELDGSQHADSERDEGRDSWLQSQGYRVLRVWNSQLNSERDAVLDTIWYALQESR